MEALLGMPLPVTPNCYPLSRVLQRRGSPPGQRPRRDWPIVLSALLGLVLPNAGGGGELAVIVNPESGVAELTRTEVINLFLGRQRRLPSGVAALTIDLAAGNDEKRLFYEQLVGKKPAEIQSYWARLVFSGRGAAPWQAKDTSEVVSIVAHYQGAIGYIDRSLASDDVKVVYTLSE